MKEKIEQLRYRGEDRIPPCHIVETINTNYIYIADYADENNGIVVIRDSEPADISSVKLDNTESRIEIHYDAFLDHALRINKARSEKQCECVLFPSAMNEENWILFVETKYTDTEELAYGYPNEAIDQIGKTALFFRNKGIVAQDKQIQGIISFPKLVAPFSNIYWTTGDAFAKKTEYAMLHNIHVEISNSATIRSVNELIIP